jgi:hypothetical protein
MAAAAANAKSNRLVRVRDYTYTDTGSQRWHLLPSGIVPVPSLQCLSSLPVLSLLSLVLTVLTDAKRRETEQLQQQRQGDER